MQINLTFLTECHFTCNIGFMVLPLVLFFVRIIKFIDQTNKLIYHREKFCQLQVSFRFLETRALVMLG